MADDTSTHGNGEADPTQRTLEVLRRDLTALREILEARIDANEVLENERFRGVEQRLSWDAARLSEEVKSGHTYYDAVLAERDNRYAEQQRAGQRAIEAANVASEKAVQSALDAREKAVSAAFESAEKAIQKAEISIEKRADATYVALGELQRMLGDLMPRVEAEQRFGDLLERAQSNSTRITQMEARVVGVSEGRQGLSDSLRLGIAIIGAVVLLVGFFIAQHG